jgi:hypothetical protein
MEGARIQEGNSAAERWFGSVLSVAVVASLLFAYSQYRAFVAQQKGGSARKAGGQMQVPLSVECSWGARNDVVFSPKWWALYAAEMLWVQVKIVVPIAMYMILFKDYVLGLEHTPNFDRALYGVAAVVLGLGLFLEGLKFGVMPVGEALGKILPAKAPLPVTLLIALLLGVGVTFAEPAIGALQTVGKNVDVKKCPYLFELLNGWSFKLVTAVGAGVGAAAVIGVLRFMNGWSLKPLIYYSLGATLSLTAAVYFFTPPSFAGVIGLAWDCGAVTTGPVTVPLVLALGVGVSASSGKEADPFASFGLVTLASLFPVVTVLSLSLMLLNEKSAEEIIESNSALVESTLDWTEESPYLEIAAGLRALGPLLAFLYVVLHFLLQEDLPLVRVSVIKSNGAELVKVLTVYPGLVASLFGIIIFNLGLNHGLSRLGNEGGAALPAGFMPLASVPGSPLFSFSVGFPIVLFFTFFLGVGATMAEPALAALGITVQRLTEGKFDPRVLARAVPVGVASGLVLGIFKVPLHA